MNGTGAEWAPLIATAAALREGRLGARALAEVSLDRARRVNGALGAFVSLRGDDLLEEAEEIDRRRAAGETLGPLAGVPIVLVSVGPERTQTIERAWRPMRNRPGLLA